MRAYTKRQLQANDVDLDIHRAATLLEKMADEFGEKDFDAAARALFAARHLVRRHMHEEDVKATT